MSGGGEKGSATTKTPGDFLKSIRGRPVVVKLNSGVDYRGQFLYFPFPLFKFDVLSSVVSMCLWLCSDGGERGQTFELPFFFGAW